MNFKYIIKNKFIILIILLFIIILILFINYYLYNNNIENFLSIEDGIINLFNPNYLDNNDIILYKEPENESKNKNNTDIISNKKETKFIYVLKVNNINKNNFKYLFYDKNSKNYLSLTGNLEDKKEINLYNIKNDIMGKLLYIEYNKYIFKLDIYNDKNIYIDFYNDYNEIKIYMDDDDKYFYIKKNLNSKFNENNYNKIKEYNIFVYSKKIGKIDFNHKIIVYNDYKDYLNIFGIGYIILENIDKQ
jgi:hypothetical protein